MALEKQIQVLSVDTGNFYSNHELYLHKLKHKIMIERKELKVKLLKHEKIFIENGLSEENIIYIQKCAIDSKDNISFNSNIKIKDIKKYIELYNAYFHKTKKAAKLKNKLSKLLENKINSNIASCGKHNIRELKFFNNSNNSNSNNIISVFDSSFTRMIGAKPDELTEDFIIVQTYYFSIIKSLINFGFIYKDEKYIYFTSSAGQIRTKKCVFIKEAIWNKYERTIMCGLTVDNINAKGGCNPNKYLAYLALSNSATDVWNEFDIDKTIVIDDFETEVYGTYDFIDDKDYSIRRISDYVPIPHTDGAGMMLPDAFGKMQKNMMVRLPWVKGLVSPFPFDKFVKYNNCSSKINDIYGKTWDIFKDDIQVIFTKSQFKMH